MSLVRPVKAAVVRPFIRNEKVAELLYTVEKKEKKKFIIFQVSLDWYDVYYKSLSSWQYGTDGQLSSRYFPFHFFNQPTTNIFFIRPRAALLFLFLTGCHAGMVASLRREHSWHKTNARIKKAWR